MTRKIKPKNPDTSFLATFLNPVLFDMKPYAIDVVDVPDKLDQNETAEDWPAALKERVLDRLRQMPWNRYPAAFAESVTERIAHYAGVDPSCVITSPGSNLLITMLINAFTKKLKGKFIIPRPSFPLYESTCKIEGLDYEVWSLDKNLEYDLQLLPQIPAGSLMLFSSPNNPVGNSLAKSDFEALLRTHPQSFFLADEAYFEFANENYLDLMEKYANFISVRTCSKTLGSAGVRVGYAIGAPAVIQELRKIRLPYLLNLYTIAGISEILDDRVLKDLIPQRVANLHRDRAWLYNELRPLCEQRGVSIKDSQANFFLVRWPQQDRCLAAYQGLIDAGILVRNISGSPQLSGCLRITVGTAEQNRRLVAAAKKVF